jgi:hypothetical protein
VETETNLVRIGILGNVMTV